MAAKPGGTIPTAKRGTPVTSSDVPLREYIEVTIPIREYFEALRAGDEKVRQAERLWTAERDRRYTELAIEREKALKIKETADLAALGLAREIQTYKDEKANELREQISRERVLYATREDLASLSREITALIKSLSEKIDVVSQRLDRGEGTAAGSQSFRAEYRLNVNTMVQVIGLLATAAFLYAAFHR